MDHLRMLFSSRQEGEGHAEKEGGHGGDFIQLLKSVSAKTRDVDAAVTGHKNAVGVALARGKDHVLNVDDRGRSKPPQLFVSPVTKVKIEPGVAVSQTIAVSEDFIAYALKNGSVRVLMRDPAATGKALIKGDAPVADMCFSCTGRRVILASQDGKVSLHDVRLVGADLEANEAASVAPGAWASEVHPAQAHPQSQPMATPRVAAHPTDPSVFAAAWGKHVALLDTDGNVPSEASALAAASFDRPIVSLAFSPCGTMLAVGEVGGLVHVLESSGRVRLCSIDASHHGPLGWIAWLPSERPGGVLAVGCDANRILTLWEPMLRQREGKCVQVLTLETLGGHSNRERFANTASLVPSHSLIVLANALPSSPPGPGPCSVWAVRYRTSSDATGDAVELQAVAEFQVAQPILSVAAAPGSDNPAELFAVQPIGIQRHMLDALMCAPARDPEADADGGRAGTAMSGAHGRDLTSQGESDSRDSTRVITAPIVQAPHHDQPVSPIMPGPGAGSVAGAEAKGGTPAAAAKTPQAPPAASVGGAPKAKTPPPAASASAQNSARVDTTMPSVLSPKDPVLHRPPSSRDLGFDAAIARRSQTPDGMGGSGHVRESLESVQATLGRLEGTVAALAARVERHEAEQRVATEGARADMVKLVEMITSTLMRDVPIDIANAVHSSLEGSGLLDRGKGGENGGGASTGGVTPDAVAQAVLRSLGVELSKPGALRNAVRDQIADIVLPTVEAAARDMLGQVQEAVSQGLAAIAHSVTTAMSAVQAVASAQEAAAQKLAAAAQAAAAGEAKGPAKAAKPKKPTPEARVAQLVEEGDHAGALQLAISPEVRAKKPGLAMDVVKSAAAARVGEDALVSNFSGSELVELIVHLGSTLGDDTGVRASVMREAANCLAEDKVGELGSEHKAALTGVRDGIKEMQGKVAGDESQNLRLLGNMLNLTIRGIN